MYGIQVPLAFKITCLQVAPKSPGAVSLHASTEQVWEQAIFISKMNAVQRRTVINSINIWIYPTPSRNYKTISEVQTVYYGASLLIYAKNTTQ